MIEFFCQCALTIMGIGSVLSISSRKYLLGSWLGLLAEPFWLYTSWNHGQWGIVILSLAYGGFWIRSIVEHWND